MNTKSCKMLNAKSKKDLLLAAELIKEERLVALPTETVYGLAANAYSKEAVNNIFLAKGRPFDNPLILHVKDLKSALALFELNDKNEKRFFKLASKFWPGPLTIIAKKSVLIPDSVCAGKDTVAVRVPSNLYTLRVLNEISFPLAMPSANISSRPSPTRAIHVIQQMGNLIDAVLDGGESEHGIESSVVYIDSIRPQLLRPGSISLSEISSCLDEEVVLGQKQKEVISPGQNYLHYSPKVMSVSLIESREAEGYWNSDKILMLRKKEYELLCESLGNRPRSSLNILMPDDYEGYAHKLYDSLHESEKYPNNHLVIIAPDVSDEHWYAIFDRINRAAKAIK